MAVGIWRFGFEMPVSGSTMTHFLYSAAASWHGTAAVSGKPDAALVLSEGGSAQEEEAEEQGTPIFVQTIMPVDTDCL